MTGLTFSVSRSSRSTAMSGLLNFAIKKTRGGAKIRSRRRNGPFARGSYFCTPRASKHLRVLREVGLVRDRKAGKQRLYGLDARGLRPVHEWTGGFERFWNESFDRLDEYVQDLKQARQEE